MSLKTPKALPLVLSIFFCIGLHAKVVERIVAIVNDDIITESDLEAYRKKLKTGGLVDEALLRLTDPKTLLNDREALIQHLIGEKILDSEVRRRGLEITVEQVEKEIRGIARQNGITRDQLKAALLERGISYSDYQDFIRTTKQRQQVIELEVSSKIKISDEDVAAHYAKTKGGTEVYEYKLAHILFLNRSGGPEEAKQRAKATLGKVGKSLSFEALAKEYSEDPNFTKGGVLGTFRSGELSPEMEAAARNLSVGDTSGVVSSRVGYHILKLLDKKLIVDPALEKEKPRLRALLFGEAFKKQFTNWLATKRDDAFIKLN